MASQETIDRIRRVSQFASKQPMQKLAYMSKLIRGATSLAAPAAARTAARVPWSTTGKVMAGLGVAGAAGAGYGGALGAYHGLGMWKPPDQANQFNSYKQHMDSLQKAYQTDINDVAAGTYNPLTGQHQNSLYSSIFGFTALSPQQRAAEKARMEKLLAAGNLGDYNNRGWFSPSYDQAKEQALAAANAGISQGAHTPGIFGTMMLDGRRMVSDDAAKNMQEFINKYGPGASQRGSGGRFAYIGNRPTGPVDFSRLAEGTGFGHDYSGYYQPYPLAPR